MNELQQEWMELLRHSSKYQEPPSYQSKSEDQLNSPIKPSQGCTFMHDRNKLASKFDQQPSLSGIFSQRCYDEAKSQQQSANSNSNFYEFQQTNKKCPQKKQAQEKVSQIKTSNEYKIIISNLNRTIQGLTDQILEYRRKLYELSHPNQQSQIIQEKSLSIYTFRMEDSYPKDDNSFLKNSRAQLNHLMEQVKKYRQQTRLMETVNQQIKHQNNMLTGQLNHLKQRNQQNEAEWESEKSTFLEKIQILQQKIIDKDQQIDKLSKVNSKGKLNIQYLSTTEEEVTFQNGCLKRSSDQRMIQEQKTEIQELKAILKMKDQSIEYTQKMLIKVETERISIQIQKQLLQEELAKQAIYQSATSQNYTQQQTIQQLKSKINLLQSALKEKRQRKAVPEMMSPEQTVAFLIKVLKKVRMSANIQKRLRQSQQFESVFTKVFEKLLDP